MNQFFSLIFFSSIIFGQNNNPTKKNILELFKHNNFKSWVSCNQDSLFFKSDTIYLDDSFDYIKCNQTITWRFNNLKSFWQVNGKSYGNGTGSTIIMTEKDHYKLKITEQGNGTFLKIYNKKTLKNTYLVLNAGYNQNLKRNRITLIRIN
jgi:hypothetical protein